MARSPVTVGGNGCPFRSLAAACSEDGWIRSGSADVTHVTIALFMLLPPMLVISVQMRNLAEMPLPGSPEKRRSPTAFVTR